MSETPVLDATDLALKAATHLTDQDAGAVEVLRSLARKIDAQDLYFQALLQLSDERGGSRPPSLDNVSMPTYLKFCDALGLTPTSKVREAPKPKAPAETALSKLRSVAGVKVAG